MIESIPKERALLYICIAAMLPLLGVSLHLYFKLSQLGEADASLDWLRSSAILAARRDAPNQALRERYLGADRFYLVKHVEGLPLMQREVEMLRQTLANQGIASQDLIEKRLNTLVNENKILFSESSRQTYPGMQEITESFQKSVEVDVRDLQRLLVLLEGVEIGDLDPRTDPPQLIISDFRLDKKSGLSSNEVFNLNLKLLKREFS